MKRVVLITICFGILFVSDLSFGQHPPPPITPRDPNNPQPEYIYRNERKRAELERDIKRGNAEPEGPEFDVLSNGADARSRRIESEERKRIEALTAPNPEDLSKHAEFLKMRDTGLIRLIPDFGCKNKLIVYAEGECAGFVPNGWLFSFRTNYYAELPFMFDLRLDNKMLIADGFLTQGIFVALGDVELGQLNLFSDGIQFLNDFEPAAGLADAKKQSSEFSEGIQSDNFEYTNKLEFELNSTYALRSVAYKSDRKPKISEEKTPVSKSKGTASDDRRFEFVKADKRADVIIVFKVVRQEDNGGVSVLWRELSRKKSPELVILKNERLTDIR